MKKRREMKQRDTRNILNIVKLVIRFSSRLSRIYIYRKPTRRLTRINYNKRDGINPVIATWSHAQDCCERVARRQRKPINYLKKRKKSLLPIEACSRETWSHWVSNTNPLPNSKISGRFRWRSGKERRNRTSELSERAETPIEARE